MTYYKGKCGLLFGNGNVSGIYYLFSDWDLGCGKSCGKTRIRWGFAMG